MKITREIKTGIIAIGGILLFILGFRYLKSTPIFDNNKTFYAIYKHVGGLQSGTVVSINGLAVGKVKDVRFKDRSGNLLVTFYIDNDFEFSKNSKAELYDTGIIGGKGIRIRPIFDEAPMAKSGDTLITNTELGITELVKQKLSPLQDKIERVMANVDLLFENFNQVLNYKTKLGLQESVGGLNTLIKGFQTTTTSLNSLLENNKVQLDSSLKNIHMITSNFSKLSDSIANAGLPRTIKSLESTIGSLDKLLAGIERGEGSIGKLMHNEELYTNLTNASRELDLLLQDFRLNPKRYINVSVFGKKQKDYTLPEKDPSKTKDK